MCLFDSPKLNPTPEPTKVEAVGGDQAVSNQIAEEKKRKGFTSTIATSGLGATNTADLRKTQLGT